MHYLAVILLTVLVCFLISFVIIISQLNTPADNLDNTSHLANMNFNDGDLIAISYDSIRGKLVKIFTGSVWAHIGMIVTKNKQTYVLEMAYYDENERGQILKPLGEFLNWNYGRIIGIRKYNGDRKFPCERIWRIVNSNLTEDMNVVSWLKACFKVPYRRSNKDYYFCSEYIAHLLQECGVLQKKYMPSSYKPWELLYSNLELNPGYNYADPVQLIF